MRHLFYVLLFILPSCSSKRVIDGFDKDLYKIPFRLSQLEFVGTASRWGPGYWLRNLFSTFSSRLNKTESDYLFDTSGSPDENGTYDGYLGFIQRDGADLASNLVRPDSLPFEPVFISTPILSADIGILSTKNHSSIIYVDVTDVVNNVDNIGYIYLTLIIVLITILHTASDVLKKRTKRFNYVLARYQKSIWGVFSVIIDQDDVQPKTWSAKFVWTGFGMASLVMVFGYFLNLMSTEQFVCNPTYAIDSLKDLLYDDHFQDVRPVVVKMLFLYGVLKISPPTSLEGKFFRGRMNNQKSVVDIDMSTTNIAYITEGPGKDLLEELKTGKSALLMIRWAAELAEIVIPTVLQQFLSNREWHTSKESFLPGTLNLFYSKKIDGRLRNYVDYKVLTYAEFSLYHPMIRQMLDSQLMQCITCLVDKADIARRNKENNVSSLSNTQFKQTWRLLIYGFIVSSFLIVFELFCSQIFRSHGRRKSRQIRSQKSTVGSRGRKSRKM